MHYVHRIIYDTTMSVKNCLIGRFFFHGNFRVMRLFYTRRNFAFKSKVWEIH